MNITKNKIEFFLQKLISIIKMHNLEIKKENNFINLTKLCQAGGKLLSDWKRNKKTRNFLSCLAFKLNKSVDEILIYENGSNCIRNTYGHPLIATNIAQWVSNDFAIDVSLWIEEWKNIQNNSEIYCDKLNNIKCDNYNYLIEKDIKLKLQKKLGGEIEVPCYDGFIDLLTDKEIIEIKDVKNWKYALGQILIYSEEYPKHSKRIHLFNTEYNKNIENKCLKYNIIITYE